MFAALAPRPTSRWHADDGNAGRAMSLTVLSMLGITALALLTRPDLAVVKLAQSAIIETISIRIDDAVLPQRTQSSKSDASSVATRAAGETTATTSSSSSTMTTSTEVGTPDGTVNGTPDGTANGTPDGTATGTPDGTGTQTDGTGTIGSDEVDGSDEFIAVEHDPTFSLQDLYSMLRYPDMARRAGVEGTVLVKVLVGTTGRIERIGVLSTDHAMLSDAAVDAVQRVQFTPARQNGSAVACWVRIPVRFELR